MSLARSVIAMLIVALATGCSTSDGPAGPSDGGGDGGGNGGGRQIEDNPSFASTIQEIFERRGCTASSCHGAARSGALDLTLGNAYDNLVGVQAAGEPIVRVIPGDADNSYLVIKLEGRQSFGVRMPNSGTPLDNIDLTNIKNWINQGASNN